MDSQRSLQVLSIGLDFRDAAAHGPTASESPPVRNQFGLTETSAPTPSRTRLTRNRHLGLTFRRSHLKLIVCSITRRRRSQLAPAPRYAGLAAGPVARDCFGSRGAFARAMGLATERSHQGGESLVDRCCPLGRVGVALLGVVTVDDGLAAAGIRVYKSCRTNPWGLRLFVRA